MITVTDIQTPWNTTNHFNAEIEKNKSIRIYGDTLNGRGEPTKFDKTFKVGDKAEYDSYNLSYIGTIIAIGEKTVTIQHYNERSRLNLRDFIWRNNDFVLEVVEAQNNIERQYI